MYKRQTYDRDTKQSFTPHKDSINNDRLGLIPLYAEPSPDRQDAVLFRDAHVMWIEKPAHIDATHGLFAVQIPSNLTSMQPRYFPSEIIYIQTDKRPVKGKDAFIELLDGTALIKVYKGDEADMIVTGQYNPQEDERIPKKTIKKIYNIVGRN